MPFFLHLTCNHSVYPIGFIYPFVRHQLYKNKHICYNKLKPNNQTKLVHLSDRAITEFDNRGSVYLQRLRYNRPCCFRDRVFMYDFRLLYKRHFEICLRYLPTTSSRRNRHYFSYLFHMYITRQDNVIIPPRFSFALWIQDEWQYSQIDRMLRFIPIECICNEYNTRHISPGYNVDHTHVLIYYPTPQYSSFKRKLRNTGNTLFYIPIYFKNNPL